VSRNPLARLGEFGQSVWCDDIGRDLLLAGSLKHLIADDGVSGVTSNPTIFHKAITGSNGYDEAIASLARTGADAADIIEQLIVDDIRLAADELMPVHAQTSTRDGWVSIEVAPGFAYDVERTVSEAVRLRSLVDRPNVLVKVPATQQGVKAIRQLIGKGQSINVTLIFSLERYREVMEAYLAGLETYLQSREAAGAELPLARVHSVASFFVSRVDTAVDKLLESCVDGMASDEANRCSALKGQAAVANARLAYGLFRETFADERWRALAAQGATLQRPLWASTSTKNPAYSDIMYVQELIGPDTVNTMPLKTLDAYRDHGQPAETVTREVERAAAYMEALASSGVSMDEVTSRLEREGVQAFADSFTALQTAVEEKLASL
jgi:transaldolase